MLFILKEYTFSTYGKFFKKITFLTPVMRKPMCVYQGPKLVNFSEKFSERTKWVISKLACDSICV